MECSIHQQDKGIVGREIIRKLDNKYDMGNLFAVTILIRAIRPATKIEGPRMYHADYASISLFLEICPNQ